MVLLHLVKKVQPGSAGRETGQEKEFETWGAVSNSLGDPVGHQFCVALHRVNVQSLAAPSLGLSFYQQLSVSQIKVDKVQIIGVQSSFAVCLDQDEQKILQSVTR